MYRRMGKISEDTLFFPNERENETAAAATCIIKIKARLAKRPAWEYNVC